MIGGPRPGRATQIIATLGPASDDARSIGALIEAGMDVARVNFSHARHVEAAELIRLVRAMPAGGQAPSILGDLQGPKLRIGDLEADLTLEAGDSLALASDEAEGEQAAIAVHPAALGDSVHAGTHLYLKDGTIELEVVSRTSVRLDCVVRDGGVLTARAGVHIPAIDLGLPALTEQDRADIAFAAGERIEWLAMSFVHRAADLEAAREEVARHGAHEARLVAKIETRSALEDLDAIARASDALMVARGDLGVEVGVEEVPLWQRRIIATGRRLGVPVIVATEMLESMRTNERPTRAEASDVAHAVWEGASGLLLSAETAVGVDPARVVATMDRIVRRAEAAPEA